MMVNPTCCTNDKTSGATKLPLSSAKVRNIIKKELGACHSPYIIDGITSHQRQKRMKVERVHITKSAYQRHLVQEWKGY